MQNKFHVLLLIVLALPLVGLLQNSVASYVIPVASGPENQGIVPRNYFVPIRPVYATNPIWTPYTLPSAPWDGEGLIPNGAYYQNYNEYVSVFSGLLTVRQTDFVLQDRGLGIVGSIPFTRIYREPTKFAGNNPVNYTSYPYVNMGYGWSLSLPWLTNNDTIHLWNGQGYKITWTNNTFENHLGDHFILRFNNDSTYTLMRLTGITYTFNSAEQLVSIADPNGNTVSIQYQSNQISQITAASGHAITLSYTNGLLSSASSRLGTWQYGYSNGNLVSVSDPLGRSVQFQYSPNSYLLSRVTYVFQGYTSYTFTNQTNVFRVTQEVTYLPPSTQVRKTTFSYTLDQYGYTTLVTASVYNGASQLQGKELYYFAPTNATLLIQNSSSQNMQKDSQLFNTIGEVTQHIWYPGGSTVSYTDYANYDNWGNAIYARKAISATTYRETFFSYLNTNTTNEFVDFNGQIVSGFTNSFYTQTVNANIHNLLVGSAEFQSGPSTNRVETYAKYDDNGNAVEAKQLLEPNQWIYSHASYDQYGQLISTADPNGNIVYSSYSSDGRLLQHNQTVSGMLRKTTYQYYGNGLLWTINSPSNELTQFFYDAAGRQTKIIYPDGGALQTSYDDTNKVMTITDPLSHVRKQYFDGLDRTTKLETYNGTSVYGVTNYSYDWADRKISVNDPLSLITSYTHDFLGRTTQIKYPDNNATNYSYDPANGKVTVTDPAGQPTDYYYDWRGMVIKVGEHYVYYVSIQYTYYTYDSAGNLIQLKNQAGKITTGVFDSLNRLSNITYPDTTVWKYSYDSNGNIVSVIHPRGITVGYVYDEANELKQINLPYGYSVSYTYNLEGQRTSMTNTADGTSEAWSYDSMNRPLVQNITVSGTTYKMSYTYDTTGNVRTLTYPDGTTITYTPDALNRIYTVKQGSTTLATLSYDKDNRITQIAFGNGVNTKYYYNKLGRPIEIWTYKGTTTLQDLYYHYDQVGDPTSMTGTDAFGSISETYGYDSLHRLQVATGQWSACTLGYSLDAIGNRNGYSDQSCFSWSYTYDANNKLQSATYSGGSTTYTYDNDGDLTQQLTRVGSTTNTYNYDVDVLNHMGRVRFNGNILMTMYFDDVGRRIKLVQGSSWTVFAYPLNGNPTPIYTKTSAGTVTDVVFAYSIRLLEIRGGTKYYTHVDAQGSVKMTTNSAGTVVDKIRYLPFGIPYQASGSENFKYVGKWQDNDPNIYYFGARYYDPQTGHFLTPEFRASTADPQLNMQYHYARNNPLKFIDVNGRESADAAYANGQQESVILNSLASTAPPDPIQRQARDQRQSSPKRIRQLVIEWRTGLSNPSGQATNTNPFQTKSTTTITRTIRIQTVAVRTGMVQTIGITTTTTTETWQVTTATYTVASQTIVASDGTVQTEGTTTTATQTETYTEITLGPDLAYPEQTDIIIATIMKILGALFRVPL